MIEKDEFNEYGVRQNVNKEKIKNSTNYSMIIIVTVLFSIFNFVVGYMIGKFLGNSQKTSYVLSVQESQNGKNTIDDIVGLPSSNNYSQKSSANTVDVSDLEEVVDDFVLENNGSSISSKSSSLKDENRVGATGLKSDKKQVSSTSLNVTRSSVSETSTKSASKKVSSVSTSSSGKVASKKSSNDSNVKSYYIQVSANENKDVARDIIYKLNSMGIKNASVINVTVGNKNIYRVRIGAFNSYEEAHKVLEIARKVNKDAFIVVSPR